MKLRWSISIARKRTRRASANMADVFCLVRAAVRSSIFRASRSQLCAIPTQRGIRLSAGIITVKLGKSSRDVNFSLTTYFFNTLERQRYVILCLLFPLIILLFLFHYNFCRDTFFIFCCVCRCHENRCALFL